MNIRWVRRTLQFLKTASEFTFSDDNGLVKLFLAALTKNKYQLIVASIFCQTLLVFLSQLSPCLLELLKTNEPARFVHTSDVFQWVTFNQFIYPLNLGSSRFCRHVSRLINNMTFFYEIRCFLEIWQAIRGVEIINVAVLKFSFVVIASTSSITSFG